jgi:hypothetical protein
MIFKILAAIFTGIGGHYMNRRWDKAILFLCLFIFYAVAVYAGFYYALLNRIDLSSGLLDQYKMVALAFGAGVFMLWFVSIIVTVRDSENYFKETIQRWTFSGLLGALLTTLMSTAFLVASVFAIVAVFNIATVRSHNAGQGSLGSLHNFYTNVYFGGGGSDPFDRTAPPAGEGVFKGRITYDGAPAEAVTLALSLNSKYRVENVVTDANGIFSLNLPPGSWLINSINTVSWEHRPPGGDYSMRYEGEPKLEGERYFKHANFRSSGFRVEVVEGSEEIQLNLRISKNIELLWPDNRKEKNAASISDTISWNAYPNADRYYVEIAKLTRDGDRTIIENVAAKVLDGQTRLALSSLQHIESDDDAEEYSLELFAFAEDGTVIGQSAGRTHRGTFVLTDGNVLVDELQARFELPVGDESKEERAARIKARFVDNKRTDAAKLLIDEQMFVEAQALLARVDSAGSQGKKEVLSGYIHALQGECAQAAEMFKQALAINPDVCILEEYKSGCD